MSEEEIKKIAKEEFMNNLMEHLDSALIFTYIHELEQKLQQKENIIKEVREKLINLNDKFKTVSGIPFNVSEIVEMIEILEKGI